METSNDNPPRVPRRQVVVVALAVVFVAACSNPSPKVASNVALSTSESYAITISADAVSGLPKCAPALYGTTALVQSPVSIYSCQVGTWFPISCTTLVVWSNT